MMNGTTVGRTGGFQSRFGDVTYSHFPEPPAASLQGFVLWGGLGLPVVVGAGVVAGGVAGGVVAGGVVAGGVVVGCWGTPGNPGGKVMPGGS
jgi:hypothetical protein